MEYSYQSYLNIILSKFMTQSLQIASREGLKIRHNSNIYNREYEKKESSEESRA